MSSNSVVTVEEGDGSRRSIPVVYRLPRLKIGILCWIQFCESFNANALFAYVGMVCLFVCVRLAGCA